VDAPQKGPFSSGTCEPFGPHGPSYDDGEAYRGPAGSTCRLYRPQRQAQCGQPKPLYACNQAIDTRREPAAGPCCAASPNSSGEAQLANGSRIVPEVPWERCADSAVLADVITLHGHRGRATTAILALIHSTFTPHGASRTEHGRQPRRPQGPNKARKTPRRRSDSSRHAERECAQGPKAHSAF
jgi:hypothetical protein